MNLSGYSNLNFVLSTRFPYSGMLSEERGGARMIIRRSAPVPLKLISRGHIVGCKLKKDTDFANLSGWMPIG